MSRLQLELAVQSVAGALVARQAGADRVELCAALGATGGLTPSLAMTEAVVAAGLPVQVLIRCRPGPFLYDRDELRLMARDITLALRAGAAGVVVGALTGPGDVDQAGLRYLHDAAQAAAPGCAVTFHRAMDVAIMAGRAETALDALLAAGLTRVLTSGGAERAVDGTPALAALAAQAAGGIEIMAGGGVRPADIAALAQAGVSAVHLSAKGTVTWPGGSTGPGGGTPTTEVTDPVLAREAAEAVARLN